MVLLPSPSSQLGAVFLSFMAGLRGMWVSTFVSSKINFFFVPSNFRHLAAEMLPYPKSKKGFREDEVFDKSDLFSEGLYFCPFLDRSVLCMHKWGVL